jgi:hypothetical protein
VSEPGRAGIVAWAAGAAVPVVVGLPAGLFGGQVGAFSGGEELFFFLGLLTTALLIVLLDLSEESRSPWPAAIRGSWLLAYAAFGMAVGAFVTLCVGGLVGWVPPCNADCGGDGGAIVSPWML